MTDEASEDVLRGVTLKVYRLMLRKGSLGIREVQRALHLSSPSVAAYHLSKLERAGLLKLEKGQYIVANVMLRNLIVFRRILIPKYFFYSMFFVMALILQLTLLRPDDLTVHYIFSVLVSSVAALMFIYETIKVLLRHEI